MTEDLFIYEKPAKRNFLSFLLYSLYSFFLISPIAVFSKGFSMTLIPVIFIQFTIALLSLRMLIWLIFGKEKIRLTESELIIERSGTFFLSNKQIPLNKIRKIKLYKNVHEQELGKEGFEGAVTNLRDQFPVFKIRNVGRIIILDNDFNEYKMLNGLSIEEGEFLIKKLTLLMNKKEQEIDLN